MNELWRLFNLSASFYCIAGLDGYFKHINPCFVQMLGYTEDEFLSTPIIEFVHPHDVNVTKQKFNSLKIEKTVSFQSRFRTVYGDYKWLSWSATHPNNDGYIYASAQDCTDRHEIEKALMEERISKERKIIEATLYGKELEKAEMGKELHDNINQMLSTVKLYHEMALSKKEMTSEFIEKATEILMTTIEEIRGLSKTLVAADVENISLLESVNDLISTIRHARPIKISFFASKNKDLPGKVKITLFRIIQEQLNNVLKHAQATKVVIRLFIGTTHIRLSIRDDGKGFNVSERKAGIGLKNIMSRAQCYNGEVKIDSAPGEGCSMAISIPLKTIYDAAA